MAAVATTKPTAKPAAKRMRMFRISDEDYEDIRRRAKARRLSITDYVVGSCLGRLNANAATAEEWMSVVEERLALLERAAGLGALDE